jgi:hypothetical protein
MEQTSEGLPLQNDKMATPIKTTSGQKNVARPALGDKYKICLFQDRFEKLSLKFMDKSCEVFVI